MWIGIWLACSDPTPRDGDLSDAATDVTDTDDTDVTDPNVTDTDPTPTDDPDDTGTLDTSTDPTTDPGPTVDCTALTPLPAPYVTYGWAPPLEDFTFTNDGHILGVIGGHLQEVAFGGASSILVPNLGDARGTRILPDGRVAIALVDSGTVLLVDPNTGGQEVLASGLANPNGIAIGDDGNVYVTTSGRILRLKPADFSQEIVAEVTGRSFDGISFSPDYSRLYFNEEVGRIHWVDFDSAGNPGPVQDGPAIPIGGFSLLDGMAVDACGNLYTTEMGSTVWRVSPSGDVDLVVEVSGVAILPALNFGPGTGGFDDHTLYVQDFLGRMHAVDVGVPGKWEPHQP
jgi:hypothetical protein